MKRETAERIREMRAKGATSGEIAYRLRLSESTVRNWWGEDVCSDCNAPVDGSQRKRPVVRCESCDRAWCATEEGGLARSYWTRERIIEAIQWWADKYGEAPATTDWDPWHARHLFGDEKRARRFERDHKAGRIPSFRHTVKRFGTWNNAIAAAGFQPRDPFATAENMARRQRARAAA